MYATMELNQPVGAHTGEKDGMVKLIKSELDMEAPCVSEPKESEGKRIDVEKIECQPEIDVGQVDYEDYENKVKDKDIERIGTKSKDTGLNTRMRRSGRKAKRKVNDNFVYFRTEKHSRRETAQTKILPSNHKKLKKRDRDDKIEKEKLFKQASSELEILQNSNSRETLVDADADQNHKSSCDFVTEVKMEIIDNIETTETDQDIHVNVSSSDIGKQMLDKDIKNSNCKVSVSNRKDYVNHVKEMHNNLVRGDTTFKTKNAKKEHLHQLHSSKTTKTACKGKRLTYKCTYDGCLKEFKDNWTLKKHIKGVHLDIREHQCDLCGYRFKTTSHLKSHVSSIHTKDSDRWHNVKRIAYAERPFRYKCTAEGCLREFKDICERTKHFNTVHLNIRKYQCEFCGYCVKTGSALKAHLLAYHTKDGDNKIYQCDTCCKTFKKQHSLNAHITVHTGTKRHTCSFENCGKSFRLKCSMKKHERIHTDFKPYHCDICKKRFSRKFYLETHMYKHTGVKNYSCDICHKSFSQNGNLRVHRLLHAGDRPLYECQKCSFTSNFKSNLTKHLKQHDE